MQGVGGVKIGQKEYYLSLVPKVKSSIDQRRENFVDGVEQRYWSPFTFTIWFPLFVSKIWLPHFKF
jgi:hypothetical protein